MKRLHDDTPRETALLTKPTEPLTGDKWMDLLAALRADLKHAGDSVAEAFGRIATAADRNHQRNVTSYNQGYHDAIKQVIDLVERVERR